MSRKSCGPCIRAKVKCNQERPCTRCVKRGIICYNMASKPRILYRKSLEDPSILILDSPQQPPQQVPTPDININFNTLEDMLLSDVFGTQPSPHTSPSPSPPLSPSLSYSCSSSCSSNSPPSSPVHSPPLSPSSPPPIFTTSNSSFVPFDIYSSSSSLLPPTTTTTTTTNLINNMASIPSPVYDNTINTNFHLHDLTTIHNINNSYVHEVVDNVNNYLFSSEPISPPLMDQIAIPSYSKPTIMIHLPTLTISECSETMADLLLFSNHLFVGGQPLSKFVHFVISKFFSRDILHIAKETTNGFLRVFGMKKLDGSYLFCEMELSIKGVYVVGTVTKIFSDIPTCYQYSFNTYLGFPALSNVVQCERPYCGCKFAHMPLNDKEIVFL